MRMVEDDILGSANAPAGKAYRPNANHIVVFITDGNPSQISYCDKDYSFSTGYSYKREDLIKSLKAKATRIVPVGVGKGISSAFLSSLSHNMPSHAVINGVNTALPDFVRVDGGYTQMNALLDTIATVACPTAPPTAPAPTFAPTTAVSVLRTTKLYRHTTCVAGKSSPCAFLPLLPPFPDADHFAHVLVHRDVHKGLPRECVRHDERVLLLPHHSVRPCGPSMRVQRQHAPKRGYRTVHERADGVADNGFPEHCADQHPDLCTIDPHQGADVLGPLQ